MADLYPVNSPVQGVSQGLFPAHVVKKLFRQYISEFPLAQFMGFEPSRPIVIHKMRPGEGWQYTVGQLQSIDYKRPVLNFDQVSGSGQTMQIDEFSVKTRKQSFLMEMRGKDLMELGTPIDIPENIRPLLIEACQRNLNMSILESAMYKTDPSSPNSGGYIPATEKPSYDRVVLAGIAPGGAAMSASSTADRTAYYNKAGITTAWNAMTGGVDYATNGLSAKHLMRLKSVASAGGYRGGSVLVKGTIENKIRPAYMKTYKGAPSNEYLYFCSPESYAQLTEDPAYYRVTTARGVISSPNQPNMISGASYRGEFNGIHIYEVEELSNYVSTSADDNKQVAWELFVGAAAWSLGWFLQPKISFKPDVTNTVDEYATHEIRGQEAIKFKAKQAQTLAAGILKVEQGIIHSFVRV